MPKLALRQPGKAPSLKLSPEVDFTGGLNATEDRFNLAPNESPDLLNVDVQRRGGIERRKAVALWGAADPFTTGARPSRLFNRKDVPGASPKVLAVDASTTKLAYSTGSAWTQITTTAAIVDHAQMNDVSYFAGGTAVGHSWDGSSGSTTALTTAVGNYESDYAGATGGVFPLCKTLESHMTFMWAGAVTESGAVLEGSRLRFSHPGAPTAWAENDWVGIGDGDGDEIQRIVSFRDHLVVFKRYSVWAVYGYSRETFQVVQVSKTIGATGFDAIAATESGVWFFSAEEGLFVYDGQQVQWAFAKLFPLLEDGTFDESSLDEVHVGHVRDRVWVRIPLLAGGARTYVVNPALGAWTVYELDLRSFLTWFDSSGQLTNIATNGVNDNLVQLEQDNAQDNYGDGAVDIESYYVTRWMDGGSPFVPKRWRRPEFILAGRTAQTIQVKVYADYNDSAATKTLLLDVASSGDSGVNLVWDAGASSNTTKWDTFKWAVSAATKDEIIRGGSIGGSGRALAFRVIGPVDESWELRGFTLKFRPKNPRS